MNVHDKECKQHISIFKYHQLRARRVLMLFNNVLLRTRGASVLFSTKHQLKESIYRLKINEDKQCCRNLHLCVFGNEWVKSYTYLWLKWSLTGIPDFKQHTPLRVNQHPSFSSGRFLRGRGQESDLRHGAYIDSLGGRTGRLGCGGGADLLNGGGSN